MIRNQYMKSPNDFNVVNVLFFSEIVVPLDGLVHAAPRHHAVHEVVLGLHEILLQVAARPFLVRVIPKVDVLTSSGNSLAMRSPSLK